VETRIVRVEVAATRLRWVLEHRSAGGQATLAAEKEIARTEAILALLHQQREMLLGR
jgi:hypothetical protein